MSIPIRVKHVDGKVVKPGSKPKKKRRARWSNYLITINTQIRSFGVGCDEERCAIKEQELRKCLSSMLDPNNIPNLIEITREGDKFEVGTIEDIDVSYVIETRGKRDMLHAHMLIKIQHRTLIRLKYGAIKQHVLDCLGLENVYFNSKLLRHAGDTLSEIMEQYFSKYIVEEG